MRTIELSSASKPLAAYIGKSANAITVVTARNKPIAAIVSLRNVDRESLALSSSPEFIRIVSRARREFRRGREISLAEMRQAILSESKP